MIYVCQMYIYTRDIYACTYIYIAFWRKQLVILDFPREQTLHTHEITC